MDILYGVKIFKFYGFTVAGSAVKLTFTFMFMLLFHKNYNP